VWNTGVPSLTFGIGANDTALAATAQSAKATEQNVVFIFILFMYYIIKSGDKKTIFLFYFYYFLHRLPATPVIPAKAGIHCFTAKEHCQQELHRYPAVDPRLCGDDEGRNYPSWFDSFIIPIFLLANFCFMIKIGKQIKRI